MNRLSKVLLGVVCVCLMCVSNFAIPDSAYAAQIRVYVDDEEVAFPDAKPYIQNNRTLVPVRFISEQLGATIQWAQSTRTVTIIKGEDIIKVKIGGTTITKNGVLAEMDVAPAISGGRTMVPLRFISENLGVGIEWNQEKYAVYISTTEEPGNVVVTPPNADELDKQIQEMAKVNSSVGNLYNADADETREFISGLSDVVNNLGSVTKVEAGYAADGANTSIGINRETSDHYITILQSNRKRLSFDATWAMLDLMFSTKDATKVWYDVIDYLEGIENGEFTPATGSIDGYNYTIDKFAPSGFYVYFDKQ